MRRLRFAALLLLLPLLLCACGSRFSPDERGMGYVDKKTDRRYLALPTAYEAAAREVKETGAYVDKKHGRTVNFYPIPGLDAALYLTDDNAFVYCAADEAPDAKNWAIDAVLVCEEDAVSVENKRLTDPAEIAPIRDAWFTGEQTELPLDKADFARRLKFTCEAYPNLYYCVSFYAYEDGAAYLRDVETGRAVVCPAASAEVLRSA